MMAIRSGASPHRRGFPDGLEVSRRADCLLSDENIMARAGVQMKFALKLVDIILVSIDAR